MTSTKDMIAVMQAWESGDWVEERRRTGIKWESNSYPTWNWPEFEYRIKDSSYAKALRQLLTTYEGQSLEFAFACGWTSCQQMNDKHNEVYNESNENRRS